MNNLLNEKENIAADAFMMRHYKKPCRKTSKAAALILRATATGIGLHIEVECPYCGKKEDISDYDSW